MYLTRIQLDIKKRDTMKALSNPNMIHGAVEEAFGVERKRKLWRIDCLNGKYFLLVVSEEKPDLSKAAKQFGVVKSEDPWEMKNYDVLLNKIKRGDIWHFRLTANPTVSHSRKDNADEKNLPGVKSRGKVYACAGIEGQRKWLSDRAVKHGFELSDGDFDIVNQDWHIFKRKGSNRLSVLGVTYEGVLKVTDAELFRKTLCSGIGREKAYGMGMLTVADKYVDVRGEANG